MVLVWDADVDRPGKQKNASAEFVKKYVIGRKKIEFKPSSIKVSPLWTELSDAVSRLPRRSLCALYMYTTQMYSLVSERLRSPKPQFGEFIVDFDAWPTYVSVFSEGMTASLFMKKYTDGRASSLRAALDQKKVMLATEKRSQELFSKLDKDVAEAAKKDSSQFNATFHEKIREHMVESSDGFMFFAQANRVLEPGSRWSAKEWYLVMPTLRSMTWRKIFAEYVKDIDAIFDLMPATSSVVTLHRGAAGVFKKNASYSSMTLSKRVAKDFVDSKTGCCVTTIRLPPGSKMIPLFGISRYPVELEVLLPRGQQLADKMGQKQLRK